MPRTTAQLRRRRRLARLLAVAAVVAAAACAWQLAPGADDSAGQQAQPPVVAQPRIDLPISDVRFLGPVAGGAPGEVWAYGAFGGTATDNGGRRIDDDEVVARYTPAEGWRVEGPVASAGGDFRSPPRSILAPGAMSPGGAGVIAGDLDTIAYRPPGGRFAGIPGPTPALLPGERLVGLERGMVAAADAPGGGAALAGIGESGRDTAVARWDGQAWTREPIELPPSLSAGVRLVQLAARGLDDAWALARANGSRRTKTVLLRRVTTGGGGPRWEPLPLQGSQLLTTEQAAVGEVAPLPGSAQSLTLTAGRVWIDLRIIREGVASEGTALVGKADGAVAAVFCDAGADVGCTRSLGHRLASEPGYQSYAWDGPGLGSRVITYTPILGASASSGGGAYLQLAGDRFDRVLTEGLTRVTNGARGVFTAPDDGWLGGLYDVVRVSRSPQPDRTHPWPVAARRPLLAIAAEPGKPVGSAQSGALAVGDRGTVARHVPGRGWVPEYLLTSSGARATPRLRGIAWPEPSRAYAVGDRGEMWLWRGATGLWEPDPSKPLRFVDNLTAVAFQPGSDTRGYAVGQRGALLAYGKSWSQEALPAGTEDADFLAVAFAGSQALVPYRGGLLVNDGSGWRIDESYAAFVASGGPAAVFQPTAAAGLPDGGAVIAGRSFVAVRDGPGGAWRYGTALPSRNVYAAAAVREGAVVRPVLSVSPGSTVHPPNDPDIQPGPGQPPAPTPVVELPIQTELAVVLRETAHGWRDEQSHERMDSGDVDLPYVPDQVLALLLDASGTQGWAVGGRSGRVLNPPSGLDVGDQAQTASILRYPADGAAPPGFGSAPVPTPAGVVRIAVGGGANCAGGCAHLDGARTGPDVSLSAALASVGTLTRQAGGPAAFVYAGGRNRSGTSSFDPAEAQRYAALAAASGTPFFAAPGHGETASGPSSFSAAFAGFPEPFGTGPPAARITPVHAAPASGARTHYAFDVDGALRVIVIDNGLGRLAPPSTQVPAEDQLGWLTRVMADGRRRGIPMVVVGHRDLRENVQNTPNVAADGTALARVLVSGGASAYFFVLPGENVATRIPDVGGGETIPAYGSGTLSYPTFRRGRNESGYLIVEVDPRTTDPRSGRARVGVRLIPLIDQLAMDALDGTLLRRSVPALFEALGRRPAAGQAGGGDSTIPGSEYIVVPTVCEGDCEQRLDPEYEFSSSDPDLVDFVRRDPSSDNLRDVYLAEDDKPVTDPRSGLVCPFNAGTATLSVRAGGLVAAATVQVQSGSVERPCGTRPLRPDRFTQPPDRPGAPAGPPPEQGSPVIEENSAPPPPPPPPLKEEPVPGEPAQRPQPFLPVPRVPETGLRPIPPPPPPQLARPAPPTSAGTVSVTITQPVAQVEREREKEEAIESQSAFARYDPDAGFQTAGRWMIALIVLAAGAGAVIGHQRRPRLEARAARSHARTTASTRRFP